MAKKSFEDSLDTLEKLIDEMENNEVSLEESLKHYEKGIGLIRTCQEFLTKTEGKFKVLLGEEEKELKLSEATPASFEDLNRE